MHAVQIEKVIYNTSIQRNRQEERVSFGPQIMQKLGLCVRAFRINNILLLWTRAKLCGSTVKEQKEESDDGGMAQTWKIEGVLLYSLHIVVTYSAHTH